MSIKVLIVFGTRPEAIKLAPVILELKKSKLKNNFAIVNTSQHKQMLDEQLNFWNIKIDYSLTPCPFKNNLSRLLSHTLSGLQDIIDQIKTIEYIVVQGDTNTTLACSNLAVLNRLKLIHIEAGLRSFDLNNPYPEEFNRVITAKAAYFHFAPTELCKQNLEKEGIDSSKILITGNTIIEALQLTQSTIPLPEKVTRDTVLITLHRRENIETNYIHLLKIVQSLTNKYPQSQFIWVSHPNSSAKIISAIESKDNFKIIGHLPYNDFIQLYDTATVIITDSGGVVEEASEIGIPLVVFRKINERDEPMHNGHPMITSMVEEDIMNFFDLNINKKIERHFSFGDGKASKRISNWLCEETADKYFDTVIVGGGPAGTGLFMKMIKDGTSEKSIGNFALIEQSDKLISGSITSFEINSDTLSDIFLECLDGKAHTSIDLTLLKKEIDHIKTYKGRSIPLKKLSAFFLKLNELLQNKLKTNSNCNLFLNTTVEKIIRLNDGTFQLHISGEKKMFYSQKIVVASGGIPAISNGINIAGILPLGKYISKVIHSDNLLKNNLIKKINADSKIVILGGSHSAFSSAKFLLDQNPELKDEAIHIWCNKTPLIYFNSKEEATENNYNSFTDEDICPLTKRIFRLAGLRMDGKELYLQMLGAGNRNLERRVTLNLINERIEDLENELGQAELIILANGYKFNMIPLIQEDGQKTALYGEQTGHWVNHSCEVLEENKNPISNLYAVGLATGFIPSGELGGEPSFKGQTNGIWYYQNALAGLILNKLQNENITALP